MAFDNQVVSTENETENWLEMINQGRVELVRNIDFDRQLILTFLQSKNIIDEEDIQIIRGAGPSRQQQVSKFLDILSRTGRCGYECFLEVLEIENQVLFELITGKKATKRSDSSLNVAPHSVLTNQQFVDHDRKYLASELEKSVSSNHRMSHMQSLLTKEKCLLQEENRNLKQVISEKNLEIEELEKNLMDQKRLLSDKPSKEENLTRYLLKAQENAEKSQLIINYLARIMAMKDEQEILHKEIKALKVKNASLLQKLGVLSSDYKWQRSRSELLSRQVQQRKTELKDVQLSKKKLFALEFELAQVTEEKDAALQRVKEFRDVMTALNIQCDILHKEKFKETERHGQVSKENADLEEENDKLRLELKIEANKSEMLQQKNQRLQKDNATFKEQCSYYLRERENFMHERDQLVKECDDIKQYNRELRESRDEAIKKEAEASDLLDKTRLEYDAQLQELSEHLMELQDQIQQTKKAEKNQICSRKLSTGGKIGEKVACSNDHIDIEVGACFRYRRDTDLLNSARAKLCASEGDLTKIYQASDYGDMMDVFKDLRSTKSAIPETFHTLPSSCPPNFCFFNKYQEDAIQNPILAGIFPDEKINKISCSASFTDFTKTTQSQTVERFVDKKPVKDYKHGNLKQKFKRFTNLSNLRTLLHH